MVMIDDAVGKYMYTMPFGWTALALYFGALSRFFLLFFLSFWAWVLFGGPGASVFLFEIPCPLTGGCCLAVLGSVLFCLPTKIMVVGG